MCVCDVYVCMLLYISIYVRVCVCMYGMCICDYYIITVVI